MSDNRYRDPSSESLNAPRSSARAVRWLYFACTLIAGGIAAYSLWVWWSGDWRLAAWDRESVPISPSTAWLLLLVALALPLYRRSGRGPAAQIAVITVGVLTTTAATAVLFQDFAGFTLRWEQWLAGGPETIRGIPVGRMSPFSAGMFLLLTFSLVTLLPSPSRRPWWRVSGKIVAAIAAGFAAIDALAYVMGTPLFYGSGVIPMAFLTAAAFVLLNLAVLLAGRVHENVHDFFFGPPSAGPALKPVAREQRLLIGLTAAAVAIVAIAGSWYLRSQQKSLKNGIAAELTAIATLKITQITAWREERLWDARRLMRTPYLARSLKALAAAPQNAALRAELRAWVEEINSTQDFDAVVLFDREMKPVLAAPPSAGVSGPRLQALLRAIPSARDVLDADLHRGPTGAIHMDLVGPVLAEDEAAAVGAILLRINPEKLMFPLLHGWPVPSETAETLLFRREGNEFLYLNNPRHEVHAAFVRRGSLQGPRLLEAKVARGEAVGLEEDEDYRGVPVLGVGHGVPGTPWFIVAKIDQAEAYGPLRRDALMVVAAMIATLCAVGLGAGFLWRQRTHVLLQREIEAERERRALTERLALVTRHANDIILLMDAEGRILEANDRALAAYGYTLAELQRLPPGGLRAPSSQGGLGPVPALDEVFNSPPGAVFEKAHQRKDGSLFPVEVSGSTFEADGHRFNLGIYRDISQRKAHEDQIARLTRLYAALSHINQTIVRAQNRNELFDAICRILVEFGGFKMAWIGWREAASDGVAPVASAGDAGGYLQETGTSTSDPPAERGPTRTALREGRTDVWPDLVNDPRAAAWRETAARHGFLAAIALPVRRNSTIAGALTVFAAKPGILGDKEISLLQEAATDVSFALDNFEREALRRQAKAALRRSEEEHRLLFANHPIPMWVCDSETLQYIAVNKAAVTHYGYSRQEFLAMTIKDIRPEADIPALLSTMSTVPGSRRQIGPVRHRKKNGEIILAEISSEPVTLEGRPARLVLAQDVTTRHRAEEALRESERRYRSLFVNLVEGFAYCQMVFEGGRPVDFIYLEVNPAFSALTGLGNVVGRKVSEVVPGIRESDPGLLERYGRVVLTGRTERFELYVAGLKMWCDISVYRPGPERFVAVFDVITARKESERRLREQAELLNKANDAIVVTDLAGRFTFWNEAASRLFGWSAAEIIGRSIREVTEFNPSATGAAGWASDQRRKLRVRNRRGDPLLIETSVTTLADESGQPTGYLGISTDITEREKLEEKFLRAQRLESIGMLAAGITHDLNNVLAPIGMASALLRHHLSDAEDLRLLDALDKCATRGAALVRQILGFVHGIGGEPRIVQVKHLLRDIVEVIRETYPKSIVLDDDFRRELWPILANPTQVHQVLLNLCVNARDAMPAGGTLRLHADNRVLDADSICRLRGCEAGLAAKPGRWVMLEVADTGGGIAPELRSRIWDPFFTTKPADQGTGLGLATVRGIIEAHQGFITLETDLDRGSAFRVYLPAATPDAASVDAATAPAARRGNGELLLLADDEELIRDTAKFLLVKAGYRVITASDGAEAAACFAAHATEMSLVITDLDMPNLDGAGLARAIQARNPDMKILAMSGAGSTKRPMAGPREQFAAGFVAKPFTAEALLSSIERLLPGKSIPSPHGWHPDHG